MAVFHVRLHPYPPLSEDGALSPRRCRSTARLPPVEEAHRLCAPHLAAGLPLSRRRSANACEYHNTNLEASSLSATWPFFSHLATFLNLGRLGCLPGGYC